MIENQLKRPKTEKKIAAIIDTCNSATDIASAITGFWAESVPGSDQQFIIDRLSRLSGKNASESDIAAFTKMTTALMGRTYKSAKSSMFSGSSFEFMRFEKRCESVTGLNWINFGNEKVWKFYFVSGDAFRIRDAIKQWKHAGSVENKDRAALQIRKMIQPVQESNGALRGPVFYMLINLVSDLLDNQLMNIFKMMQVSSEQPNPLTINQEAANASFPVIADGGKAVLSQLSTSAYDLISNAKTLAESLLDSSNPNTLEWLNIRNSFGEKAADVQKALISGRFGYGNAVRRDGCQNFINSGPSHGAGWLKSFMEAPINAVAPAIEELQQQLIKSSTVDDAAAAEWVNGIKISKQLIVEYDRIAGADGRFMEDLKGVYRLAGGKISTLKHINLLRGRSFASAAKKSIDINPAGGKRTLWHEVGHHFEFTNPNYVKLAIAFLLSRTANNQRAIAPLNQIFENNYANSEIAILDNLSSPYAGKVYGADKSRDITNTTATEVFSSGFEYLAKPSSGAISMLNDDGLVEFVTGILNGADNSEEKSMTESTTAGSGYASVKPSPEVANTIHQHLVQIGIDQGIQPQDLHVTLMYSKNNRIHTAANPDRVFKAIPSERYEIIGEAPDMALVMHLDSPDLHARFNELLSAGAEHSFPDYLPHLSVKYGASGEDLQRLRDHPISLMELQLSDETFKPVKGG